MQKRPADAAARESWVRQWPLYPVIALPESPEMR
jgi:hypothetical protein